VLVDRLGIVGNLLGQPVEPRDRGLVEGTEHDEEGHEAEGPPRPASGLSPRAPRPGAQPRAFARGLTAPYGHGAGDAAISASRLPC